MELSSSYLAVVVHIPFLYIQPPRPKYSYSVQASRSHLLAGLEFSERDRPLGICFDARLSIVAAPHPLPLRRLGAPTDTCTLEASA